MDRFCFHFFRKKSKKTFGDSFIKSKINSSTIFIFLRLKVIASENDHLQNSNSCQSQVSLCLLCQTDGAENTSSCFTGILFFLASNCSGSFMLGSGCEQVTHTVFCDLVKLASGQQLKHINQCQLSFNSMHNYIYIVGKLKKSHKSIRISN